MSRLNQFGWKRSAIGVFLILFSVCSVAATLKMASKPKVSYDYLQQHIELSYTPIDHIWEKPRFADTISGRKLSGADHVFMSRILTSMEKGQKIWAGQIIVEGNARDILEAQLAAWKKCQQGQAPCTMTVRLSRTLTPTRVNGDLRVANIEEHSHRVDLIAEPFAKGEAPQFKISKTVIETRNLRFAKRRNGWALRTIDVLDVEPVTSYPRAPVPMSKFAGINYYPAKASWRAFWTKFPEEDIQKDLAQISALGGNSLRIFLTHSTFTDSATAPDAKARLVKFMDMAQAHGLKVIPTVFDLRPDYRLENWASDVAYLKSLLPLIKDHPALLALDLKNQIDLDIPANGVGLITGWISVMSETVRREFPNIPITVGFSKFDMAILHGQDLDVISYHDYDPIDGFSNRLNAVRDAYPDKPIWITEMGTTVWHPLPFFNPAEQKQAARLARQLSSVERVDGVFIWTLTDFDLVGSDVVGWQPWRKKQQAHYGLYDLDGNARPSADIFAQYARNLSKLQNFSKSKTSLNVQASSKIQARDYAAPAQQIHTHTQTQTQEFKPIILRGLQK